MSLVELPNEILFIICSFLPVGTFLTLTSTNRALHCRLYEELRGVLTKRYGSYKILSEGPGANPEADLCQLVTDMYENPMILSYLRSLHLDLVYKVGSGETCYLQKYPQLKAKLTHMYHHFSSWELQRESWEDIMSEWDGFFMAMILLYPLPNLEDFVCRQFGNMLDMLHSYRWPYEPGDRHKWFSGYDPDWKVYTGKMSFAQSLKRLHFTDWTEGEESVFLEDLLVICSSPNLVELEIDGLTIHESEDCSWDERGFGEVYSSPRMIEFRKTTMTPGCLFILLNSVPLLESLLLENRDTTVPDYRQRITQLYGYWFEERNLAILDVDPFGQVLAGDQLLIERQPRWWESFSHAGYTS